MNNLAIAMGLNPNMLFLVKMYAFCCFASCFGFVHKAQNHECNTINGKMAYTELSCVETSFIY